jgi:hypothetical protein
METVAVDREFDTAGDRVRSVLGDVMGLFEAAEFDVERTGDRLTLTRRVALAEIELTVRLCEDEAAALAYEQLSGPFEAMETRYFVDSTPTGSHLTIETSFEGPAIGFGSFLNGTVIERRRRAKLDTIASLLDTADGMSQCVAEDSEVEAGGD